MRKLMWTAATYVAGVTSSVWLQRKLRRRVKRAAVRYGSNPVIARGRDMAGSARLAGREVKAALREGRDAMRETEDRLRVEHGLPVPPRPSSASHPRARLRGRHRR